MRNNAKRTAPNEKRRRMVVRAGIMGATGYAGAELVRILANHPNFEICVVTSDSEAGTRLADIYPAFAGVLDNLILQPHAAPELETCDVAFLAVPHKAGMLHAPRLVAAGVSVVDLSADFRFSGNQDVYEKTYGLDHVAPELLARAVYGQPETMAAPLAAAAAERAAGMPAVVGCAGCYVTASILAATPAITAGFVDMAKPIIVDAISGVTGAGGKATARTHFCSADETLEPYGLPYHRHMPEIAQSYARSAGLARVSDAHVVFTPHLAPLRRGLLATVYLPLAADISNDELLAAYAAAYAESPLVTMLPQGIWPKTSSVAGSARAQVGACVNSAERMAVAVCAIDNLGKGAAAQGVQCANILFGLPEDEGLRTVATHA